MAPYSAEPARPPHPQANRPVSVTSRITPAIPLALTKPSKARQSRAPEEAGTVLEGNGIADYAAAIGGDGHSVEQPANVKDPLTPASCDHQHAEGPNGVKKAEATPTAASPAEESTGASVNSGDIDINTSPSTTDTRSQETTQESAQEQAQEQPQPSRQEVPHELPPPFYPAEHRSTPASAMSSSAAHNFPPSNQVIMHQPRPSANSIVFGGHPDSSSPSPAPPLSAGMMHYPPAPPPGFGGASFGPPHFYTGGHAHHFSEPHAHMMYPPMSIPPPGAFAYRRDHPAPPHYGRPEPWFPSDSPMPYPMAPPPGYPPHHIRPQANGALHLSRSPSQSSARTQDQESTSQQYPPEQRKYLEGHANGHNASQDGAPVLPLPNTLHGSTDGLRQYLRSQFGSMDFADYILEITLLNTESAPLTLPVHGLLVGRSPRLRALMFAPHKDQISSNSTPRMLKATTTDKFVTSHALIEVLKYLYGGPLLDMRQLIQGLQPFSVESVGPDVNTRALDRMREALGYAASGYFLGLEEVVSQGFAIAKALLRWDTLNFAVGLALDGGLSPVWRADPTEGEDQSALPSPKPSSHPTYGNYSTQFLRDIVEFLAYNFPKDFQLDSTAPQLPNVLRLPVVVESRPSISNPRLSRIRFGELPLEEPARPDFVTGTLSSILLSLPFPVLKVLLEHHGLGGRITWPKVISVMRTVVEERENQRGKARKARTAPFSRTEVDELIYQNLHWEERVEPAPAHGSGFRLARTWIGAESTAANGVRGT